MPSFAALRGAIESLGGIATREQLRRRGFSGYQLTYSIREGTIVRLRRAWYALPELSDDRRIAVSMGGRLGALSAAASYGWWRGLDSDIHVSWPEKGNVAKPGRVWFDKTRNKAIVHHWRQAREESPPRDSWREMPLQTLAQVMLYCDRPTAVACADSAIHIGSVNTMAFQALMAGLPLRVGKWAHLVDGNPDSGIESIVRIWLIDCRIRFVLHQAMTGVGEVDFLIGESLVIETDGSEFHDSTADRIRDARRDFELGLRGYIVVRLRYSMVMYDWERCAALILQHIARGDDRRQIRF